MLVGLAFCVCVCVCVFVCVCVSVFVLVFVFVFFCAVEVVWWFCLCFLSVMMSSGMEGVVGWFVVVWEDLRWVGGCEVEVKYVLHRVGG